MIQNRFRQLLPSIVAFFLLIGTISLSALLNGQARAAENGGTASPAPFSSKEESSSQPLGELVSLEGEMRAVWIPFMSLNMQDTDHSEQAFRDKFDHIVAQAKEHGMNTLVVHVRSHGDAMYPSDYYPWSHLLMGTQGQDPGFDPLQYMVEATHQAGMQFHAWLNPLRIQVNQTPAALSQDNPYTLWRNDSDPGNDQWVLDYQEDKYYNPAIPQVRERIIDGVEEIVSRYAVDAIHFDDYFYPTSDASYDQGSYDAYVAQLGEGSKPLSLADWRTTNINTLISGVYSAIKAINPEVKFGISPQGNISNDIGMGADVYSWGSVSGYVDYLCPQLYVNFEHPVLPFDKMADDWCELVTNPNIDLYFGLGVYKIGTDADNGTWNNRGDILKKQVEYGREKSCGGFMLYSWDYLDIPETEAELQQMEELWTK